MKPYILLLTLIVGAGPWFPETGRAQGSFDPEIAEMISHVSDSAMHQTISDLQGFGTRYSYASTRDTVARWIKGRFEAVGISEVYLDAFTLSNVVYNVVATIHGNSPTGAEIVIGAHYDSYSQTPMVLAPGADDNASGTSAVIELARVISGLGYKPQLTLHFIAFTGEEQGLLGSKSYAQKASNNGRDIRAMLNFDQIGCRDLGSPYVSIIWYEGAEELRDLDMAVIPQYTALGSSLSTEPRSRSDSYSFATQGYRAIWWLGQGTPFYHTTYDLLAYLDVPYAAEIARAALAFLLTFDKMTVGIQPVAETLPNSAHLYQNYPNPFNPTTQIQFTIANRQLTIVKVFDLLGREVTTLVNEVRSPGTYTVDFDGSNLSSGVYIYRLQAGDFVQTKKLVILR